MVVGAEAAAGGASTSATSTLVSLILARQQSLDGSAAAGLVDVIYALASR